MQKQKKRRPRIRRKLVNGEWYHVYHVVVEQVRRQTIIIEAKSQDEAELQACGVAERNSCMWFNRNTTPRGCTWVEMTDGSWERCNDMGHCDAR